MKYAFIYPGQGSQTLGMGKDFKNNFSIAKELSQRASDILHIDMDKLLEHDENMLNQTQYTQPAIFLVSAMAHAIVKQECNIEAKIAFGHSLGEVSAYCLNGGASFENSILLTHKRGQFMAKACEDKDVGMMVCLGLETEVLESLCDKARNDGLSVWAANYNVNGQIVLAGIKSHLEKIGQQLKEAGAKRTMLLKMSVASHCPLLLDSVQPFHDTLQTYINDCEIEIISNATLQLYKKKEEALENLTQQLIKPVLYDSSVLKAKELGIHQFIELGNGNVLTGLNNKIADIPTVSINTAESIKQLG